MALATVSAVVFITFLDNTIVSVTLADVQTSLGVGVSGLQWIVDGYMLAFAGLMLTGGTLGDLIGRKKVMLVGLAVFCAGSLVGALASDTPTLIAGRVVMGVGAAASEPGTLSVLRHMYPERRRRAQALGVWTAVSGLALSLGPIIGGAIVGGAGWRGVFWFNVAFGLAALAAAAWTLPESADPEGRKIDVPGLVLSAATVTAATFAVIQGESAGYGTWWIDLLFAGAALGAVAFVRVERRSPDPVLKLDFLRKSTFLGANVVAFAANFGVFAVFFFTALYLQLIAGFSGWQIAIQFLSMAAAMVIAGPAAGWWAGRAGARAPMVLGWVLAAAGMLVVDALLSPNVSVPALAWALAIVGFGFGMVLVTMTASVLTLVPPERSGMAASTVNTSRELGGVLGVAVLGAIVDAQLTARLADKLAQLGVPPTFRSIVVDAVTHGGVPKSAATVQNPAAAGHQPLVVQVIRAAEDAFGTGLHIALVLAAGLLLAAAVVAAFTVGRPAGERFAP
ncbi:MAG: MFS transporter [Actinobacteria bacterium]|nr:MAG: MFS transporter [Actinomycetota bacterium]